MQDEKKKIKNDAEENGAKDREYYLLQASQKAVIYDPEKDSFLLVKYADENGFYVKRNGSWGLVGGRLSADESLEDGLLREIAEELGEGVKCEIHETLNSDMVEYKTGKAVSIEYLATYDGGEIKLSEEHSEYKWLRAKEIEENEGFKPWLKNSIKKAAVRIEEMKSVDGWKRCMADFENYKKRQSESQKEVMQFMNLGLIEQIIPVIDNFHASTDHVPDDQKDNAWVTGIMYIQKQLEKVLEDNNVVEIKTKIGDDFDPRIHDAISNNQETGSKKQGTNDGEQKNKVKKIVAKGYEIGGKVVRPARVVVE